MKATLLPKAMKLARAEAHLSQVQLAAKAGVSIGYVGMIETGQRQPRAAVLGRLAEAMGVAVADIAVIQP